MRLLILAFFLSLVAPIVAAQESVVIGYLELAGDRRYSQAHLDLEIQGQPWGRPFVGAEVALGESRFPAMAVGAELSLLREAVTDIGEAIASVQSMYEAGIHYFLLDLPANLISELAAQTSSLDVALFNIAASEDVLRQQACQPNLFHTLASQAMRNDALAQHLISRQWRDVLLLIGPAEADQALAESWRRSANRFGLRIVDERSFVLGSDPRQEQQNNPRLLTTGVNYDVVYVADSQGEFSQQLPYATQRPRLVVGSGGLVPQDWHWSWVRHGATQLNNRLEEAGNRHGTSYDWAAWVAVKAIVESMVRTQSTDFEGVMDYLRSDEMVLDGFKGYRMGFRDWNNQLRQPILLASGNWVIEHAPIEGFLHPVNYLDTLGFDPTESQCELP